SAVSGLLVRAKLDLEMPGLAVAFEPLATPAKRARRDLAEGPANFGAVRELAFLDDVFALAAGDQFGADAVVGIEPIHAPGVDGRVVNTDGRAEPIGEFGRSWSAVGPLR